MPSLLELLLQPWKIFAAPQLILAVSRETSAHPEEAAAATASAIPSWGCYTRDLGEGDIQSLCKVLGYEMPSFIFFAAVLILLLFVFTLLRMAKESSALGRVLGDLESYLQNTCSNPNQLTTEEANTLGEKMNQTQLHATIWSELRDQLAVSTESPGTLSSEKPLGDAFGLSKLLERSMDVPFYQLIPGTLTGLGLLMTFIAILDGLSHVKVTQGLDVKGIAGLINGLSGKFFTSVVAVLCAVGFSFAERMMLSPLERTHNRILLNLQKRVRSVASAGWFQISGTRKRVN